MTIPADVTGKYYLQYCQVGNKNGVLIGIHDIDDYGRVKEWTRLPKIDLLRFIREQVNINAFK